MNVLHPGLLAAGIAAIAIPIIIHLLLRRRRKPIKWAAMRFLLEAYQKQRRKLKLQQWLLLAARCLLVALIAIALARPLLDGGVLAGGAAGRTVYLVIDNSVASGLRDEEGATSLERHQRAASDVLGSLGPGDRVALITLASPAESVVLPASSDPAAVRRIVESLEPQDSAADLRRALEFVGSDARGTTGDARHTSVVILSDFLEGSVDLSVPLPPALAGIEHVQVAAPAPRAAAPGNAQIVSLEPVWDDPSDLRPGQARVLVRRTGASVGEPVSMTLRIWAQQRGSENMQALPVRKPLAERTLRIAGGRTEVFETLQLDRSQLDANSERQIVLRAEIDADGLLADNRRLAVVPLRDSLRVGVIAQRRFGARAIEDLRPSDWFRFALTPVLSTPIEIIEISPAVIDAPQLAQLEAAIVAEPHLVQQNGWTQLRAFVDRGGLVLLCPPAEANVHLWAESFEQAFDAPIRLAREAQVFDPPVGLQRSSAQPRMFRLISGELPELIRPVTVSRALQIEAIEGGATTLLELENGAPWMMEVRVGREGEQGSSGAKEQGGVVVYMASPPDPKWTQLPLMPLMVPLVQEVLRQGVAEGSAGVSEVVAGQTFGPPTGVRELSMDGDGEPAREGLSVAGGMTIRHAGVWRGVDETGRNKFVIAANADVDGARTGVVDRDGVRAWLADATGANADAAETVRWMDAPGEGDVMEKQANSSPFDLMLLMGVLALALVEMGLARWASYAGPWRNAAGATTGEEQAA